VKTQLFATLAQRMAKTVLPAVVLALAVSSFAQTRTADVFPVYAASSANIPLPKGVKLIARPPLDGLPVTRMYTQWEYGRTYLYMEHGRQTLTALDVTKSKILWR
jgi:hypothetical protein